MNRDFVDWLARERLPMFDLRYCRNYWHNGEFKGPAVGVWQNKPCKFFVVLGEPGTVKEAIMKELPQLRTPIGELALDTALKELAEGISETAGPLTEETKQAVRMCLREVARLPTPTPEQQRDYEKEIERLRKDNDRLTQEVAQNRAAMDRVMRIVKLSVESSSPNQPPRGAIIP